MNALLKRRYSQSQAQKRQLLEQDELLYLIVNLKKIPQKPHVNSHKVPLPYPLIDFSTNTAKLCMFIDDRPKSSLTKDTRSKKIKSKNILHYIKQVPMEVPALRKELGYHIYSLPIALLVCYLFHMNLICHFT
ncbi:hypothetical protein DITRI_Ditri16bG0085100 [Diplodiscus trichospermus]